MTHIVRAIILGLALTALSACGKKGDIKPPAKSEFSAVTFSFSPV